MDYDCHHRRLSWPLYHIRDIQLVGAQTMTFMEVGLFWIYTMAWWIIIPIGFVIGTFALGMLIFGGVALSNSLRNRIPPY